MWVEVNSRSFKDCCWECVYVIPLNNSKNGRKEGANGTRCEGARSDQRRQPISLSWKVDQGQDRWRSSSSHSDQRWSDAKSLPHPRRFHVESSENSLPRRLSGVTSYSESGRIHVCADRRREYLSRCSSPGFHLQGCFKVSVLYESDHSWRKRTRNNGSQDNARRSDQNCTSHTTYGSEQPARQLFGHR